MSTPQTDVNTMQELKKALREEAHTKRNAQENKDGLSEIICNHLMDTPEYKAAKTVLWYVDVRSEVRTRYHFPKALGKGQKVVVPYCVDGLLDLFLLESMDELSQGMYRILDPGPTCATFPVNGFSRKSWTWWLSQVLPSTCVGAEWAMVSAITISFWNM